MTHKTTDLDVVQAALDAFGSGEPERIAEYVHSDFEGVVPPSMSAEPDEYRGHAGVRRYFDGWRDSIDDLGFSAQVVEECGDWILATLQVTGVGRASGIPVDLHAASAIQMRDGKLGVMVGYPSLEEARAAISDQ